jgi:hypothetical protein
MGDNALQLSTKPEEIARPAEAEHATINARANIVELFCFGSSGKIPLNSRDTQRQNCHFFVNLIKFRCFPAIPDHSATTLKIADRFLAFFPFENTLKKKFFFSLSCEKSKACER